MLFFESFFPSLFSHIHKYDVILVAADLSRLHFGIVLEYNMREANMPVVCLQVIQLMSQTWLTYGQVKAFIHHLLPISHLVQPGIAMGRLVICS